MALRVEKRALAFVGALLVVPGLFAQQSFQYEVWRGHSRIYTMPPHVKKSGDAGTLTITETGVSFQKKYKDGKAPKKPVMWHWEGNLSKYCFKVTSQSTSPTSSIAHG